MSKLMLFLSGGFFSVGTTLQVSYPYQSDGSFSPWFLLLVPSFILAWWSECYND